MNQSPPQSIQEAIDLRQQQTFVGRGAELAAFGEQLTLAWDDPRRRYVLSVFGQGGVGKSTLLGEYVRLAQGGGAAVALSDDNESDAPAAMARLAAQLDAAAPGDLFHAFNERRWTSSIARRRRTTTTAAAGRTRSTSPACGRSR